MKKLGCCFIILFLILAVNSVTADAKIGVFRPSTGRWYVDYSDNKRWDSCSTDGCYYFGMSGDLPVTADWNNDGYDEIAVFRPSSGTWYLDLNSDEQWNLRNDGTCRFGMNGDLPVAGDWSGSGSGKIGVFRPSTAMWYLDQNGNRQWEGCTTDKCFNFGQAGDLPVVGDWNGNGITKIGVFRPSTGMWYLDFNGNGVFDNCRTDRCYYFGMNGDQPVASDWNGSGTTKIGVFRQSNGTWYVDLNGNGVWDRTVDGTYIFGMNGDIAVTVDATIETVTYQASADTGILWSDYSTSHANTNYGSDINILVGLHYIPPNPWISSYMKAATLIRFNTPELSGKTILSAVLRLTPYSLAVQRDGKYRVQAIAQNWSESTATWNFSPTFYLSPYADAYAPQSSAATTWNVTSIVQDWADGVRTNYGFFIQDMTVPSLSYEDDQITAYISRNSSEAITYKPQLVVTFR